MFEELNKRRQAVAYNIAKSFENDIEKAIGAGYDPEGGDGDEVAKAHQVGDAHPNGKWVWTEYAPGKFDWRGIKKNATEKKQKEEGNSSKEVDNLMDKIKFFNNKYTDISKVSVIKTPKGNWDVSYDGHRLGIINADQLSEKTAKKNGWLREDEKVKINDNDSGNASTASTATTAKTDDTNKKKIIAKQAKVDKVFDQMSKFLKTKKIDGFILWTEKKYWNEFYNKFDDKLRSLGFSIGRNYKRSLSWNIYSKDSNFSDSVASVGTDNDLSSLRKKIKELMEA